jgi:hypothetical protein
MIQELASVSLLRPRGGTGGAYTGRLESLPGTFSLVSSLALHTIVSHGVLFFCCCTERGKKRRVRPAFSAPYKVCLPMIAVWSQRAERYRALCGIRGESGRLLSKL